MTKAKPASSDEIMLSIQGMHCAACATRIEKVLSKDESIATIIVSYPMRTAWLHVKDTRTPDLFINKIKKLGFHAKLMTSIIDDMQQEKRLLGWRIIVSLCLTLPLLIPMLLHLSIFPELVSALPSFIFSPFIQLTCATIIQFLIATPFYINAYYAIREKIANMDVLVVLGTTAAYIYSHFELFQYSLSELISMPLHIIQGLYFETTGVVITAVLIGKYIELKTAIKLQRQNQIYMREEQQLVTVYNEGKTYQTESYNIMPGQKLLVSKDERILIDGDIVSGHGYVEEAFLSGEEGWIEKQTQDKVWAGSTLCEGELIIEATQSIYTTRLSMIKHLIKLGQAQKSKIQAHIDQVTQWFVPFILLLALAALAFYVVEPNLTDRILASIAVLLVACPCALGLATPISMSLASTAFLKQGLVVKDSRAIERLAKVNQFVFDKTGTLTNGQMKVSFFHCWKGSRAYILNCLAGLEAPLEHPISYAIKRYCGEDLTSLPKVNLWQHYLGMGVGGYINKKHIIVGNERLLHHLGLELSYTSRRIAETRQELGETILFMYEDRQLVAILGLTDSIKVSIKEALHQLEQLGIQTIMATGDHPSSAERVAKKLGIKQIYSKLLPEQKLELIEKLKQHKVVAMVGDGINDAPAIATSDVGIAISNGSREVIESGHITLLYADIKSLPKAIKISRLTVRNIKQNLLFAFAYNIVMLPLAIAGYVQPWMAGIAMALSSIMVVGNAFRLHLQLNKPRI